MADQIFLKTGTLDDTKWVRAAVQRLVLHQAELGGPAGGRACPREDLSRVSVLRAVSPIDGEVFCERPLADAAAVGTTFDRAEAAFPVWRSVPLDERRAAMERFLEALRSEEGRFVDELAHRDRSPDPLRRRRACRRRGAHACHVRAGGTGPWGSRGAGETRLPPFVRRFRWDRCLSWRPGTIHGSRR